MPLLVLQSLLPCNIYVLVGGLSQSGRKMSLYLAMRSMLSANRSDFVPPSDCNSVNEVLNAPS